jgi:alkaline phosphatase D
VQVLGVQQWAWLERSSLDTQRRGVRFRYVVNGVNLGQLRAFNLPAAEQFREMFGIDPNAPQGEIYTSAWGGRPTSATGCFRFLRTSELVDNVVMSGDSHGWFAYDLVEDAQAPELRAGHRRRAAGRRRRRAGALGLRPARGAGRARPRPPSSPARRLARRRLRPHGRVRRVDRPARCRHARPRGGRHGANPNLVYFNWKAEYGHALVHLREDRAVLECWSSPQRAVSTDSGCWRSSPHRSARRTWGASCSPSRRQARARTPARRSLRPSTPRGATIRRPQRTAGPTTAAGTCPPPEAAGPFRLPPCCWASEA